MKKNKRRWKQKNRRRKINRKKQQQQKSKCYNQQITAKSKKERAVQFRSSKKSRKKFS